MNTEEMVPAPSFNTPSTDVVISHYESLITKSIAAKTLAAAQSKKSPIFTKEEMAYLVKKAVDNSTAEVSVITPTPTITLKKGKTEIHIKNAADMVRKMEEKYPVGVGKDVVENILRQPYTQKDIGYNPPPVDNVVRPDPPPLPPSSRINTVNKNAYEIRADVLAMALDFARYRTELESDKDGCEALRLWEADDVLAIAKKFYAFVENRR